MSTAWRLDISHGLRSEPSLVEYYPRKEISSLLLKIQVSVDRWTYQLYLKHCLPNGCVPWLLFFSLSWPHPGPWPHFLFEHRVPRVLTHVYVCARSLSCIWLFVTPWTVDHKAPLSMEFSRQEYWGGFPFPSPTSIQHRIWRFHDHLNLIHPKPASLCLSSALASCVILMRSPSLLLHLHLPTMFLPRHPWWSLPQ